MSIYPEIEPSGTRTKTIHDRRSKVSIDQKAVPPRAGMSLRAFLDALPAMLKADELKAVARAVVEARRRRKPVLALMGGHVIKTGLSPVVMDLIERGYITHLAGPGATAVHDIELALCGHTSEDVASRLAEGAFGMDREAAKLFHAACRRAVAMKEGLGEALGGLLLETDLQHPQVSLLAGCRRCQIPYTLHVALGTDVVHQHPNASGADMGEASLRDFRILAATVSQLGEGGVVLNLGSAVVMPEVFLKALALARNLGRTVSAFTAANFDMLQHYRPTKNVVQRSLELGGRGFTLIGHHEIMIPLLAAAIIETEVA